MLYTKYFVDRDTLEQPTFASCCKEANSFLRPELLSFLPNLSFVMLKPDAYIRGIIPDLLDALVTHGIFPAKYQLLSLTEQLIDQLYMFVKAKYASSWWIMKKVYTVAPSLPIIVIGDSSGYPHLSAKVRDIVGPTTPIMGAEQHIRYRFRGTHRILNLIHATDDPAAAYREARIFFGIGTVEEALRLASNPSAMSERYARYFDDHELKPERPIDLSYSFITYKLKTKLLDRMVRAYTGVIPAELKFHYYVESLMGMLESEIGIVTQMMPLRVEWKEMRGIVDLQRKVIYEFHQELIDFNAIEARKNFSSDNRDSLMKCCAEIKMCLNIWRTLLSDVDFLSSNLEQILGEMRLLGIGLEEYDETVLHSAWSGISTELRDWVRNYRLFIVSSI